MTQIITTKDLTKNELSGAKILAIFVILACLGLLLNSAKMETRALPEILFSALPTQATDGSGLINFSVNINKLADYQAKLKIGYTVDGENFQPLNLTQAEIDAGSLTLAPDQEYQVTDIMSDSDSVNLKFGWNSQADQPNISSDQVKIRITMAAKIKETDNSGGEIVTLPAEESENVEIDETEVILEPEVIIENIIQTIEPESVENNEANIIEETIDDILEVIIPEAAAQAETAEEIWSQKMVVSEKFNLDNLAPKIQSGFFNIENRTIDLFFSEPMNTALAPDITKIVLQNGDGSVSYNLIKADYNWSESDTLASVISLSNIDIAFLTLDEAFDSILQDPRFGVEPGNNIRDLFGNEVFDPSFVLPQQGEQPANAEVPAEELLPSEEESEEKEEEIKEDEEEEVREEEKVEEIVIPENNKIINTRGYNKNCSFNPDELMMSAGTTAQAELSLSPLDPESEYVLTTSTLPNDFEIKILQPSGSGTGPINLEITAPANAVPRLYKLLIKYKDITPQSVSHVNNCVLRLTVQ